MKIMAKQETHKVGSDCKRGPLEFREVHLPDCRPIDGSTGGWGQLDLGGRLGKNRENWNLARMAIDQSKIKYAIALDHFNQ
jgi:hypothetical protein